MAHGDTSEFPQPDRFPATRHSAILALRSDSERERRVAMESIAAAYWRPVYTYLRLRWNKDSDAAKDLTQGFFLRVLEKDYLTDYDSAKARFRTFLRLCLDRFVMHETESARRLKRGGEANRIPFDITEIESQIGEDPQQSVQDPEHFFEQEWIRGLLSQSVTTLSEHCRKANKQLAFDLFQRHDLGQLDGDEKVTYAKLASDFDVSVNTVTNNLAYARREFRRIVLERLREITGTEAEYRHEVMTLLGADIT